METHLLNVVQQYAIYELYCGPIIVKYIKLLWWCRFHLFLSVKLYCVD